MVHDTARKPALKDTGYTRSAFSHGVSAACCPENCLIYLFYRASTAGCVQSLQFLSVSLVP